MNELEPLIEPMRKLLMGEREHMRYIELDLEFYKRIIDLDEAQRDYVFDLWLKVMDHEQPQPLNALESSMLATAFRRILRDAHGDAYVAALYAR